MYALLLGVAFIMISCTEEEEEEEECETETVCYGSGNCIEKPSENCFKY